MHVRRGHRRGRARVHDRALGCDDPHRGEDAVGEGNVGGEELVEADDQLRADDVRLRVEEVGTLRARARVVELEHPITDAELAAHEEGLVVELGPPLLDVLTRRQLADAAPHHPCRESADLAQRLAERRRTHLRLELAHLLGGDVRARDEAPEIHLHRLALADVVQDQVPDVIDRLPGPENPRRRDTDTFLVALAGVGGEAPGHEAAHVDHVPRRARPADAGPVSEYRPHHHHVLQVEPTAIVGVVGEEHVARHDPPGEALADDRDRIRRDAEVEGNRGGGGDDVPIGVVEHAGEVPCLAHHGRHGGLDDRRRHLLGQVLETVPDHLERDRVKHARPR